jgi:CubicO group peptidase (beta-lactamase class C family)
VKSLRRVVDRQLGRGHVRHVVAAVYATDGSVDFGGAAGMADTDTASPMTSTTPYFIASVTKMFTAAIVMRLHDQGRLDLDRRIGDCLPPSLVDGIHVREGVDHSRAITVRQLLDQTSGLADHESGAPRGGRSVLDDLKEGRDRAVSTEEAVEIVRTLTPKFPPGTPGRAHYSNTNYRLLGAIVEDVTSEPMAANHRRFVTEPLGLADTYLFEGTLPDGASPPAVIYLKGKPANVPLYLASNTSDGGIVSTASDGIRFLRGFFEGELFHRSSLARMTRWNRMFFPLRYGSGLMDFRLPR